MKEKEDSEPKCGETGDNLWLMREKVGTLGFYSIFSGNACEGKKKKVKKRLKKFQKGVLRVRQAVMIERERRM